MPQEIELKPLLPEPEKEPLLPEKEPKKKSRLAWFKLVGLAILVFLILGGVSVFAVYSFAKSLEGPVKQVVADSNEIITSIQAQDLVTAKASSGKLKTSLATVKDKYRKIAVFSKIPFAGAYIADGQGVLNAATAGSEAVNKLIAAIEPYSDLLGFKTDAKTVEIKSIEDRIVFLVNTLEKISPQLESISGDLELVRDELDKINPNRYPETIRGKSVRAKIVGIQETVKSFSAIISQAKPLIELLPTLLGDPNEKTYMLLFQNDGELRPTGGFLTAYAYLKVSKGKITPLNSYNIYDLDARFVKNVPAPEPIKKYLNESRWNLRNQNMSPDFKLSMDRFTESLKSIVGLPRIDGIIAIDTYLPVKLLETLGPIGVGGWGNFSAKNDSRCDCPQVVYALEDIISKPGSSIREDRKAVLGPLMHSILSNAMGSPKHMWPKFLNIGLDAIGEKHLMFYFFDQKNQAAAESFNAAGRIKPYDYDYLHINDSNFGGAKSDIFIVRDVEQEVEVSGDKITKKVTITYNNPAKGSNCNLEAGQLCLNGVYRDYVRLYVPKGSRLVSVVGSEVKESITEDLGKTVFEAFFTMRPQSSSKLVFNYELPAMKNTPYRLLIQKQPGLNTIKHNISLNGNPTSIDLSKDTELILE